MEETTNTEALKLVKIKINNLSFFNSFFRTKLQENETQIYELKIDELRCIEEPALFWECCNHYGFSRCCNVTLIGE